jgi:hypothetical protein
MASNYTRQIEVAYGGKENLEVKQLDKLDGKKNHVSTSEVCRTQS